MQKRLQKSRFLACCFSTGRSGLSWWNPISMANLLAMPSTAYGLRREKSRIEQIAQRRMPVKHVCGHERRFNASGS
jgi:hypothetical protein